jgi:hypothetical protein
VLCCAVLCCAVLCCAVLCWGWGWASTGQVYVGGVFAAAILDDVVMEPLTGRLLAVLYRYSTPGVHHLYFYQPFVPQADSSKTGSSRVLAR